MADLIHIGTARVAARVFRGAWIADCLFCNGAVRLQFGIGGFECVPPGCGAWSEVIWPTEEMRHGVQRLLAMRPNPENRNWFPHETLTDLMWENGAHGVFDGLPELLPGSVALSVTDDRIRVDLLPELDPVTGRLAVTG